MSRKFNHAIVRVKNSEGRYDALSALRGQNSYELAVRYGFTGTEEEWMESIIGDGWIGAFQDLDDRFADLVAQVEAAHADGAIETSQYADGSVTRTKLAQDALCSPIIWVQSNRDLALADIGGTLTAKWNADKTEWVVALTQSISASLPVGFIVAASKMFNANTLKISTSGVRFICNGESIKDVTITPSGLGDTIALQKYETNNNVGDLWLATGNVEVVS